MDRRFARGSGPRRSLYLGTQGDIWDTQKDMALALAGSIVSMTLWCLYHPGEVTLRGINDFVVAKG